MDLAPVVLYYCACLVNSSPGTLYITPQHLCLTSSPGLQGILGITQRRHVWPLHLLQSVALPSDGFTFSVFSANTLKLTFAAGSGDGAGTGTEQEAGAGAEKGEKGQTEVLISPVLVDCVKLRYMLLEVRGAFSTG
ncbi:hypothetical protein B484DRAFT_449115 [Ochromonadaceae sp. CCMP2298]|nr:hypothetical protein B484DRAFT_449115 [Ochromonadaceae sp. CCMP2298]